MISHNDIMVRGGDQIFGVSMEDGESKIVGVELPPADEKETQKTKQKNN